jgi:hypothetical protein
MKVKVTSGLFKDLLFNGYDSIEDYDKDAGPIEGGGSSGMLDLNKSLIWRSTLPEVQDKMVDFIKEKTNVALGVDEPATEKARKRVKLQALTGDAEKDVEIEKANAEALAKVRNVPENFLPYSRRVKIEADKQDPSGALWKEIDAKFRELAESTKVDASPSRRQAGPSKESLTKADSILSRTPEEITATIAKMEAIVPDFVLEYGEDGTTPERESLARMVSAYLAAAL